MTPMGKYMSHLTISPFPWCSLIIMSIFWGLEVVMALTRYTPDGWCGWSQMSRRLREVNFLQAVVPCPPSGRLVHIFIPMIAQRL